MVNLLHQLQQPAYLAGWKTFARKPVQVIAWQIGNQRTFMFSIRHFKREQALQIFRVHIPSQMLITHNKAVIMR